MLYCQVLLLCAALLLLRNYYHKRHRASQHAVARTIALGVSPHDRPLGVRTHRTAERPRGVARCDAASRFMEIHEPRAAAAHRPGGLWWRAAPIRPTVRVRGCTAAARTREPAGAREGSRVEAARPRDASTRVEGRCHAMARARRGGGRGALHVIDIDSVDLKLTRLLSRVDAGASGKSGLRGWRCSHTPRSEPDVAVTTTADAYLVMIRRARGASPRFDAISADDSVIGHRRPISR